MMDNSFENRIYKDLRKISACYTLLVYDLKFTTPCWSVTSSLLHVSQGRPQDLAGGGPRNFFSRFGNLHVMKRHAAHDEAMRFGRGVRGHAPPRNFFEWCVLVYILIKFCL